MDRRIAAGAMKPKTKRGRTSSYLTENFSVRSLIYFLGVIE
jgi:hypothetical protein